MMEHLFDVRVRQEDADRALRRFLFRKAGWVTAIAAFWCVVYVFLDFRNGGLGYLGTAMVVLILLLVLVYITAYFSRKRQVAQLLQRLGGTPVSYHLDEEMFSAESAVGHSGLKWDAIKSVWIDSDLTLVFYSRNGYTTIPTDQIPEEALRFLASQVSRSGGKTVDRRKKAKT